MNGVENDTPLEISAFKVLKSREGFYVGREAIFSWSEGEYVPYDRASGYFKKRERANQELAETWGCE